MRRFSANYIYTISGKILKNGIVETDDSGKIVNIIDTEGNLEESRGLEFYNGIIVPGFINTHCHLELSELKNKLKQSSGLSDFIEDVFKYKQTQSSENTFNAIKLQDHLMFKNGIVAVGDICNTSNTIKVKKESKIFYYSFIEAIGLGNWTEEIYNLNEKLCKQYKDHNLSASIVPHAPYSVSENFFKKIRDNTDKESIISIHNQETESENDIFKTKSGVLYEKLRSLDVDLDNLKQTEKNSVESVIDFLPYQNNIIFVHNTYSKKEDIDIIIDKCKNPFFCLCPKSNLFIENKLPNLELLQKYPDKLTIGTDSLASNNDLSILEEIITLLKECENISFGDVIRWGTLNGAKALNIAKTYGSIEIGKTPGLNLITNFDFNKMAPKKESAVKVLI